MFVPLTVAFELLTVGLVPVMFTLHIEPVAPPLNVPKLFIDGPLPCKIDIEMPTIPNKFTFAKQRTRYTGHIKITYRTRCPRVECAVIINVI